MGRWDDLRQYYADFPWNDYCFRTKRRITGTEAIIIPRKISIVLPQVIPSSRSKVPEAPRLRWVLRQHWSHRTGYGNKTVVGGAQRRRFFNSISRRISS